METKKLFQRKKHRLGAFVLCISLIISACSTNENRKKVVTQKVETKTVEPTIEEDVPVTINSLVGVWKYSEVRTSPKILGIPPVGEILLGITEKYELCFATSGMEELKGNLKSMPTNFAIKGSSLCPSDKISEADFKISFNSKITKVYVLNEKELVLGKGISEDNKPVLYMHFTRIK
ncbi:MAG: hypothetical protein JNJ41_14975 [Bacteroidia bacterium]|nr:hypothetical protein [Bacteroidia bacterium]